jgi:uncharacterized protein (TIGR00369 family)
MVVRTQLSVVFAPAIVEFPPLAQWCVYGKADPTLPRYGSDYLRYTECRMILAEPSNPHFAEEIRASFAQQTIMGLIGAELCRVEPGMIEINLPYRSDLAQQYGYLHAGIVTTIADSACGYAAFSLMPPNSKVLSVEFKVNLLRPAMGEAFLAHAEVLKSGRTLTVVRADVFAVTAADQKQLVATMLATMICLNPERFG